MRFDSKDMFARRAFMKTSLAGAVALPVMTSSAPANSAPVGTAFNVQDFLDAEDDKTLATAAINKAIAACSASGGGTVYFPAGTYVSGSIHLQSNITLHLEAGATIEGAANDIGAYDPPEANPHDLYQDFGHSHWHNALIWGENIENIAITGRGTIDGGGMNAEDPGPGGGDKVLALKLCKNILLKDFTIKHAGHFAVLPTGCDNMIIDGVTVDTDRDGINLDCCRNVRVSNCSINTPVDDALCLKTSYALGEKRVTENVTITNCMISGFAEGSLLDGTFDKTGRHCGGLKFGTESNGDFRNIVISNCVFDTCDIGFSIGTMDGGTIENVTISNITMRNMRGAPIFLRAGNRGRGPNEPPPGTIRDLSISNVLVQGANGSHITGLPGNAIEDVRLSNIKIVYRGGGTKEDAQSLLPEKESAYYHVDGPLPSYGFFIRHAKGISLRNVTVDYENEDLRPALYADDVQGLELDNFKATRAPDGAPSVVLENVTKVKER